MKGNKNQLEKRTSYFCNGFRSGHARQANVMLDFPSQNIKFLPVDLNLKWVVLDFSGGLGFSHLVGHIPLFGWLPHLQESNVLLSKPKKTLKTDESCIQQGRLKPISSSPSWLKCATGLTSSACVFFLQVIVIALMGGAGL